MRQYRSYSWWHLVSPAESRLIQGSSWRRLNLHVEVPHPKVLPPSQWSLFLTKLGHVPSVGPHKRWWLHCRWWDWAQAVCSSHSITVRDLDKYHSVLVLQDGSDWLLDSYPPTYVATHPTDEMHGNDGEKYWWHDFRPQRRKQNNFSWASSSPKAKRAPIPSASQWLLLSWQHRNWPHPYYELEGVEKGARLSAKGGHHSRQSWLSSSQWHQDVRRPEVTPTKWVPAWTWKPGAYKGYIYINTYIVM